MLWPVPAPPYTPGQGCTGLAPGTEAEGRLLDSHGSAAPEEIVTPSKGPGSDLELLLAQPARLAASDAELEKPLRPPLRLRTGPPLPAAVHRRCLSKCIFKKLVICLKSFKKLLHKYRNNALLLHLKKKKINDRIT